MKPSERETDTPASLKKIMGKLKQSFHGYKELVCGKEDPNGKWKAVNSRASDGNLLEAINLSLNGKTDFGPCVYPMGSIVIVLSVSQSVSPSISPSLNI